MNTTKTYAEKIATDYAPKETSDLKALKKLDKKAKQIANFVSYTHGIVCTLLFGVGMCFSLNIIGGGTALFLALGGVIGAIGIVGMSTNYLLYKKLFEKGKKKYGSDILELARKIADN